MAGLLNRAITFPTHPQVKLINLQEKDTEGILFDKVRNLKVATLVCFVL